MYELCFIDLETTGLQIGVDRIVSFGGVCDGNVLTLIVNPERPIPKEVSELIGITDAQVAVCALLKDVAKQIVDFLAGRVLVGFNIHNFDLPILAEEMARVGVPFDWNAYTVIDAGTIFKKKEERTLSAAMQFYCGKSMADAHNAVADAFATEEVFRSQLLRYPELAKMPHNELSEFSRMGERRADPSGKLVWKDGKIVYNIGKSKGVPVVDDIGFAYWMLGKDFPATTKAVLNGIIQAATSTERDVF